MNVCCAIPVLIATAIITFNWCTENERVVSNGFTLCGVHGDRAYIYYKGWAAEALSVTVPDAEVA